MYSISLNFHQLIDSLCDFTPRVPSLDSRGLFLYLGFCVTLFIQLCSNLYFYFCDHFTEDEETLIITLLWLKLMDQMTTSQALSTLARRLHTYTRLPLLSQDPSLELCGARSSAATEPTVLLELNSPETCRYVLFTDKLYKIAIAQGMWYCIIDSIVCILDSLIQPLLITCIIITCIFIS